MPHPQPYADLVKAAARAALLQDDVCGNLRRREAQGLVKAPIASLRLSGRLPLPVDAREAARVYDSVRRIIHDLEEVLAEIRVIEPSILGPWPLTFEDQLVEREVLRLGVAQVDVVEAHRPRSRPGRRRDDRKRERQQYSFEGGFVWGGTVSLALGRRWRVELLYSRQGGGLATPRAAVPTLDLTTERLMAGIQEEKGHGRMRYFGSFMLGATRFTPALSGLGSDTRFAMSLGLGLKRFVSDHFGLRLEARAFYTLVESGGGIFCSGGCLFVFSGSGI